MPLLLLLLLLLITLHDAWPNPFELAPAASCLATWTGVALVACAAEFVSLAARRALRREPSQASAILRWFGVWRRWHQHALLLLLLLALYVLGWGATIRHYDALLPIPGFKVLMLLPLFAGLVLGWLRHYDAERLGHEILQYPLVTPFLSRWEYFDVHARHHFLFVLPPLVLLCAHEAIVLVVPSLRHTEDTLSMALLGIGLLASGLISIPLFLRAFLGLRSLPDGPLRRRLLATARRLHFRFNDILVWNTRNGVANAMVTGVLPWLRYVVVTDRLLEQLDEDEIEAVFGHEVGHMKHHHMFFYMVFMLASGVLLIGLWNEGGKWLKNTELPEWLYLQVTDLAAQTFVVWGILAAVVAYVLTAFGWLSRRCERQADIFGCKTASPAAFISALEKVAEINGIPRENPGFLSWWQHSTIADRVNFIRRMAADPALEPRFQRRLGWTKWSLALGMISLVVAMGSVLGWNRVLVDSLHLAPTSTPLQ